MSYSDEELKSAVSEIVQGTVSFKRDVLGPRDATSSFNEIRELVNTTLLYEPDSVFYLIFIATQTLQKVVTDETEILDNLLDAVDDLLKPNKSIDSVSSLAEASLALTSLDLAIDRSGRVGQTEYGRYLKAIEKSKRKFGTVTKLTYTPRGGSQAITDIVRPAAKAKKETVTFFAQLKTQHSKLLERVENILEAYENFELDKLATLVSKTQVTRAREQLDSLHGQLSGLTPEERTEFARDALLKVLSNKSVVTAMTNAPTPDGTKLEQGYGTAATYRLSAYGTGSAPVINGTVSAPYPLEQNSAQNLTFTLNDVTPDLDIDLLPSGDSYISGIEAAELKGAKTGPFQIFGDQQPRNIYSRDITPTGTGIFGLTAGANKLHMVVDGVSYEVALSTGGSDTVSQIASDINGATPGLGDVVTANEVAGASAGTRLELVYDNPSPPTRYAERHMHVMEGAENAVLGPYVIGGVTPPFGSTTGYVVFNSGWDDNTELKVKPNDDTGEETINLPTGTWDGDPSTSYVKTAANVRDSINGQASGFTASLDGEVIVLTSTVKGEGSILTITSAGMYSGAPKPNTGTPSFKGAATLGFYEGQEDRKNDVDIQSVINVLNGDSTFSSEAQAKRIYSELLRQRGATTHSTLTDRMEIAIAEDPTTDWPSVGELKFKILTGDNSGVYQISSVSWSGGTLTVEVSRDFRTQDTSILHEVIIYKDIIRITSLDNTTDALLEAKDSASYPARSILGFATGATYGGVSKVYIEYNDPRLGWVPADLRQRLLKINDVIKRIDNNTDVTSVTSVSEASDGILSIEPQVDPLLSLDTTQGFRIQSISYLNYINFIRDLQNWWDAFDDYKDDQLAIIDKVLSPVLLVDATLPRINSVYSEIESLKTKLTGSGALLELLQGLSVPSIFQVDQVLQSLLEQGHNRARALLLKGDVAGYMETTKEDSSYGRALMKATSAVAVKDINEPTNLARHLSEDKQRVMAEWYDDKDPLHDFSDEENDISESPALDFWEGLD